MLPAAHRLRSAADFAAVTRRGRRARCGTVVVYLLADSGASGDAARSTGGSSRVGLVVGKSVGTSVVRHQVSRRLRAQLRDRLDQLPAGARLVVRALPETSAADSTDLGRDLDLALSRLTGPQQNRQKPHNPRSDRSGSSR